MSVENHEAAHQHDQHDSRVEPMPNPCRQPVAVDDPRRNRRCLRPALEIEYRHS
jgi:hypothetical protein